MPDKTVGTLNHLIAICRDAEEFYGYAADKVSGAQLQPLLRETADLHRGIGDALRPHVSGAAPRPPKAARSPANSASSRAGSRRRWHRIPKPRS
jgi:uncharacterized protein (TIGR02284 family)